MVKKKRNHPDLQDKLDRPWCYYCERDFDDLKILISHQKAKHFKCERCGRRLNTAGGLAVHLNQVHKETLTSVENALPTRQGLEVEIFGMEGIPEEVVNAHQLTVQQQHYADIQNRAVATGNPPGGGGVQSNGSAPKKPKIEAAADLKKRLAEFKARKAALEARGGTSSGDVTPMDAGQGTQSPAVGHSPAGFPPAGSPPYGAPPQHFSGPPGAQASPQPAYSPPFSQHQFSQPPLQHGFPPQPHYAPQVSFPPQPGYAPSPVQHFGGNPYGPPGPQSFPPSGPPSGPYQQQYQGGPPRQFGAASPMTDFNGGPPRYASPTNGMSHQRQGSLPAPPGLPQKPVSNVPHVNSYQLQQMHQGQAPPGAPGQQELKGLPSSAFDESVDELISAAARNAEESSKTTSLNTEKKAKKDKEKNIKLIYNDETVSPEEKMAALPRYAFVPDHKEVIMQDALEGALTGTVGA
ncbi:uncharacterized protein BDZ99DRAFT_505079 [Mytilinidion resinicola]|uniref:C2H2-type domain-containing protein n=1 Tax=Mytilinidion resinicola TaxID=574789 RepID=A0A6A6Z9B3_9PEZI|nr:uncharacterized protein BDZ99DRAFT_505079 [Mytilinidion resinicola]KAF2817323.1 hypothetical protein BDZ99DRAFT_505079 [Mytilinidion resinicola]